MVFNQREIDSFDQRHWRRETSNISLLLNRFCEKNKISFLNKTISSIKLCKHDRIVILWLFDRVPSMSAWSEVNFLCQEIGKQCYVITDNIISFENLPFVKFYSYPELLGVTACYDNINFVSITPTKLYNCFMQRVDSVRQSWFYWLYHFNLIDKGYVSLLMKQLVTYSPLVGKDLYDYIHYNYQLDKLPHFDKAYKQTRDLIPFRNFDEQENLLPLIQDSKYSLILETYSTDDDINCWCFTEKTLRALQFPTIPLIFAQKNSVQKLKDLGFEVGQHHDALDNQDWISRQLALIDLLVKDLLEYDWNTVYNSSKHNQSLLLDWKQRYQQPKFFESFFEKVLTN